MYIYAELFTLSYALSVCLVSKTNLCTYPATNYFASFPTIFDPELWDKNILTVIDKNTFKQVESWGVCIQMLDNADLYYCYFFYLQKIQACTTVPAVAETAKPIAETPIVSFNKFVNSKYYFIFF